MTTSESKPAIKIFMQTYPIKLNTETFKPSGSSLSQKSRPVIWHYLDIALHALIIFVYSVGAFFYKIYAVSAGIFLVK